MDFREVKEFFKDTFGYICVIVAVIIVFAFVFSFQKVSGTSMDPTYEDNDIVFVSKIGAKVTKIKRGNIIVFKTKAGAVYIKRVIGIPGDIVYANDNTVYVNGSPIDEEYLKEGTETSDFKFQNVCNIESCKEGHIPEGYYFVLGDNREDSVDSRFNIIGLINKKEIIGKISFKIFPWN